jgi:hypothetical protein
MNPIAVYSAGTRWIVRVSVHNLVDELCDACEVVWINDGYAQTLSPRNANVPRVAVDCGDAARASHVSASGHYAIPQQIQIDGMPALTNT